MAKTRDIARLHPKTVSEHKRHTKTRRSGSRKNGDVETLCVDQQVWQTALRLAGNDRSRIVVESPTCVIVQNQSKRKV